jgi:hypothetical protein
MTQKQGKQQPPAGEIRQSQILSTFGPGSMMDLPEQSIIVGGLNHWKLNPDDSPLNEPRLVESIKRKLGLHQVKLYTPPARNPNVTGPRTGINNFLFPGWFVAQVDQESLHNGKVYRTRPLLPWKAIAPTGGQYLHTDRPVCMAILAILTGVLSFIEAQDIAWVDFGWMKEAQEMTLPIFLSAVKPVKSAEHFLMRRSPNQQL